jgi:hypothetical protein
MAIDKSSLLTTFSRNDPPVLVCPTCGKSTLRLDSESVLTAETKRSARNREHDAWEPEWTAERFIALFRCADSKCGEVVAVSGNVAVEPTVDEEGELNYEGMLEPKSMWPPPPIIRLPDGLPPAVRLELELAFQFFWGDFGACATKIRTSVERLMDHFKIAKFQITKDSRKQEAPGRMRPLDLSARIDKFIAATGEAIHKDHLHALRVVGNLGTHSNDALSRTEILEAFEIYEHALEELIGKKSKQIGKLAKRLSKHTGRRKKKPLFERR